MGCFEKNHLNEIAAQLLTYTPFFTPSMIAQIQNERAREVEIHVLVWCSDLHYDIQDRCVSLVCENYLLSS